MFGAGSKIGRLLWWASLACLVGGGLLWSLSPVGVELSELKFKTPDVFWKLFPSAPLLLALGVLGLLFRSGGGRGPAAKIGLWAALAGLLLVAAGDVGLYHLGVDDVYIVAAPAYRAFRAGLVLLAAGALLFAVVETRGRGLPAWVGLPFAIASLAGLLAVARDLGPFGADLWAVFGAGWAWLGFGLAAGRFQETGDPARGAHRDPTAAGRRVRWWSVRYLAVALVLCAFLATGCSPGEDASSPADVVRQEETTSPALADGKIVAASNVAYPPFEFAPRNGPKGFDIDLMNEVADRTGLEVEYRNVQFDSLLRGLSSDLFDAVISGMTITADRRQQVDFSDPYYNVDEALVVRSGSEIESTGDLEEKTLGVQLGTMGQAEAGELLNAGEVEAVRTYPKTINDAFAALEEEAVDGVIYDLPAAQEKVDESEGELELVEVIPTGSQYGIAFPKESPLIEPVNQALAEIKEDGTYEELYEKWIGRAPEGPA